MRVLVVLATLILCIAHPPAHAAEQSRDQSVLQAARLANDAYQRHMQKLVLILKGQDDSERPKTLRYLGRLGDKTIVPHILPFLDFDVYSLATVKEACYALVALEAITASEDIRKITLRNREDESKEERIIRVAALNALHQMDKLGDKAYVQEANHENDDTRAMAVTDLSTKEIAGASEILVKALGDDRRHIRRMAAIGLGKLGDTEAGLALTEALTDSDELVRRYAAEALVRLDYAAAVPSLLIALEANRATGNIIKAIRQLTGEDFGFDPYANRLDRTDAIERGFIWWNENKADLVGE